MNPATARNLSEGWLELTEDRRLLGGETHIARQPNSLPAPRTRPSICATVISELALI
jgi:hypothetical protein